jgi:cytochrome c peroxidase
MRHRITVGVLMLLALTAPHAVAQGLTKSAKAMQTGVTSTLWTATEWAKARRLSPLPPLPLDPTNALADHVQAAHLGHRLFFDPRLSPKGVACATCHQPERGLTDGLPVANTLAPLHRNTMTILNAGYYRWLTWDGSRDSLWHQAVGPLESPKEMGSSRLYVVRAVMRHYTPELTRLVALPTGWDTLWPTLPGSGKPGDPAFDNLSPPQKDAVNRVLTTILKSIGAYERQVVSAPAPFDRFVAGDRTALSVAAQRGFQHFLRLQCDVCHTTPLFSDDEFHNLGLPPVPEPDQGRAEGLPRLQHSLFRGSGPYADGPPVVRAEDYRVGKALVGSFRTPSLRELAYTAPYGHNGAIATLEAWLDHYVHITSASAGDFVGRLDPALSPVTITPQEKQELVAFLQSLSSDYASEWTQPPNRTGDHRDKHKREKRSR